MKKWLLLSFASLMLVLTGCGSNTAEVNAANENVLEVANNELKEEIIGANEKLEELTLKLAEVDGLEEELADLEKTHKEETDAFEQKGKELEDDNKKLGDENKKLGE